MTRSTLSRHVCQLLHRLLSRPEHFLWKRLQSSARRRRIKTSGRAASPRLTQSTGGQLWKIIPHTKREREGERERDAESKRNAERNVRGFWLSLIFAQFLMHRQVCSVCPHSSLSLKLFSYFKELHLLCFM